MWIDTHCHLDAPEFEGDRPEVIARARAAGVTMLVVPAVMPSLFDAARMAAEDAGGAYALGTHPCTCAQQATNRWPDWPKP